MGSAKPSEHCPHDFVQVQGMQIRFFQKRNLGFLLVHISIYKQVGEMLGRREKQCADSLCSICAFAGTQWSVFFKSGVNV